MKSAFLFVAVLLMAQTTGGAADLWKARPVKEWNREETERFLRDSPWVEHVTTMSLAGPSMNPMDNEGRRDPLGGDLQSRDAQRMRQRAVYFIEWSSAKVVRQANWHMEALMGQAVNEDVEPPPLPLYVLSVKGVYLAAFANLSKADVLKGVSLRLNHAKTTLAATDAVIRKTPEGKVVAVQFAFPRLLDGKPTISAEEKSVEFVCKAGHLSLKADFKLAKMTTGHGLDL